MFFKKIYVQNAHFGWHVTQNETNKLNVNKKKNSSVLSVCTRLRYLQEGTRQKHNLNI